MTARRFLLFALTSSHLCHAAEDPQSPADWSAKLREIYARHTGYIACYETTGTRSSLSVTMGMDPGGEVVLGANAEGVGGEAGLDIRFWRLGETLFFEHNGERTAALNAGSAAKRLIAMIHELAPEKLDKVPGSFDFAPQFLFTSEGPFQASVGLLPKSTPPWDPAADDASTVASTDKEVAFQSKQYGEVVVSRETGMMIRQKVSDPEGKIRTLAITDFRSNPGRAEVAVIRDKWDTTDAKEVDFKDLMKDYDLIVFQCLISAVDGGGFRAAELTEHLATKADYLRDQFRSRGKALDLLKKEAWKDYVNLIKREAATKVADMLADLPKEERDKKIAALLAAPRLKAKARDTAAEAAARDGHQRYLPTLLGMPSAEAFKPATDEGKKAVGAIENAIVRAGTEAACEASINEVW